MAEVEFNIERDDGAVFVIDDSVWRIPNDGLTGWHSTVSSISTYDTPGVDGAKITEQRVQAVDRTITAEARDTSASAYLRTIAERFFVPHRTYVVTVTYMGRKRKCTGIQAAFTLSEGNIYKPIEFTWTITCESPYMTDADDVVSSSDRMYVYGSNMPYMPLQGSMALDYGNGYLLELNDGFVTGVYETVPDIDDFPYIGNPHPVIIKNDGDVRTKPVFCLHIDDKSEKEELDTILIIKMSHSSSGGNDTYVADGTSLEVRDVSLYQSNNDDWLVIDLNIRPFAIYTVSYNKVTGKVVSRVKSSFVMVNDEMLLHPYLEQGENVYGVLPRGSYYFNGLDYEIIDRVTGQADNLYTGI